MRILLLMVLLMAIAPSVRAAPEERATPPPRPVVGDGLIVPGQRIGNVRLGMPLPQIIELLGPGHKREEFKAEKIMLYEWRGEGFWVSLDAGTNVIRVISVVVPIMHYRTDKGIRLLDPWPKAEAAHGKAYRRWEFREEKTILIRYPATGLQFGIVNDPGQGLIHDRIFQIGIFKPGDLPPARRP